MSSRPLSRRAGVTLIEILIAITLLSLLATGVLVALRLGFNTMDKTNARLSQNRRVVNARSIIEGELNGFVYTMADFYPETRQRNPVVYLEAEPQSMRFVTTYSLSDALRGRPQLAELQVIPGENNQGVRLILNEAPYTGPEQAGLRVAALDTENGALVTRYQPIEAGPGSFVLADRLAFCRFSYLEVRPLAPFRQWTSAWRLQAVLPLGVRIEMAPLEAAGTGLHVTTVTVPLRVDREPRLQYAD